MPRPYWFHATLWFLLCAVASAEIRSQAKQHRVWLLAPLASRPPGYGVSIVGLPYVDLSNGNDPTIQDAGKRLMERPPDNTDSHPQNLLSRRDAAILAISVLDTQDSSTNNEAWSAADMATADLNLTDEQIHETVTRILPLEPTQALHRHMTRNPPEEHRIVVRSIASLYILYYDF